MRLSDTLESTQQKLREVLLEIDCDWKCKVLKEGDNLDTSDFEFSTVISGSKIVVGKHSVRFSKTSTNSEGIFENVRELSGEVKDSDSKKNSQLYKMLVTRFRDKDDIQFYSEMYEEFVEILNKENEEPQEEEGDESRPVLLRDGRKS